MNRVWRLYRDFNNRSYLWGWRLGWRITMTDKPLPPQYHAQVERAKRGEFL
jgi:hypothetical protein